MIISVKKFEQAMTQQEKEKLYRAIDYQENSAPAHYPETYEMIDTRFLLHELQIVFLDTNKEYPCILDLQLHNLQACFKSRPSANGILYVPLFLNTSYCSSDMNEYIQTVIFILAQSYSIH